MPHDSGHWQATLLVPVIEPRTRGGIMSKTLVRVGGVSAVIAALLVVVQQVWTEVVTGPHENLPDSIMYATQLLFMVFGVIGIALAPH